MLTFAFKSAIALVLLYMPLALLRRDTHFSFMRKMVLTVLLLSLVLPFVNVPCLSWWSGVVAAVEPDDVVVEVESMTIPLIYSEEKTRVHCEDVLVWIYLLGMLSVIVFRIAQMLRLQYYIRHGCLWIDRMDGMTVYCHAARVASFSWMRQVVISADDMQDAGETILCHEAAHINLHHSEDMLLLMLVQAMQWFNPLVWIMTSQIQEIHEYEADEAVLCAGVARSQYQLLLIRKAAANDWPAFACSLRTKSLKKRFTMMTNKKSHPWSRAKALAVIPAALIALAAFATNNQTGAVAPTVASVADIPVLDIPQSEDKIYYKCEEIPQFPGGYEKFYEYINANINYPAAAKELGLKGRVIATFVVEKDGRCTNFKVLRGPKAKADGASNDKCVEAETAMKNEALRLLGAMPTWVPGKDKGQPVRVQFSVPIIFRL